LSFLWLEDGRKFKAYNIYFNDTKQISSIKETDTLGNNEAHTTHIFRLNNNIDSIFDIGYAGSFIESGTYISNISYNNNNCKSFLLQYSTYYPTNTNVDDTMQFYFSQQPNTNMLPYQLPDANAGGSIFRLLSYYLSINGYYAFNPNINLIDSIKIADVTIRYNYEFINNFVSKARYITERDNGSSYTNNNIFEYY